MSGHDGHLDDARIHDLVDGELDRVEERAARTHVERCAECSGRLARVEALLTAVHSLPAEASPSRDLWPEIESRIRGETSVIPFPGPGDAGRPGRAATADAPVSPAGTEVPAEGRGDRATGAGGARRTDGPRKVAVSVPLLWAAGIAVSLLSGGTVWLALSGDARPVAGAAGIGGAAEVGRVATPDVPPPSRVRPASAAYEEATSELEAILEAGRDLLDEETLRTIEESLDTIDRAIAEAERALARDPGSDVLHRLLVQHQRTRLRILRQATNGLSART